MLKWKVPVTIITGYLGSGKTTLLKKILGEADRKIAILMNEFGEIGVDTKIVKGKDVDIRELLGGCVCCSLTGELEGAIREILERAKPEMIVIETTGVAEPDALITNMDNISGVRLDSVVTVVDADAFLKFPSIGHTGRMQIEGADVILLNKMDLVPAEKIDEMQHALEQMNPRARIVKATYSNVNTAMLFGIGAAHEKREHEQHDVYSVASFVYRSERLLSKARFATLVSEMPKEVYRSKGHVNFSDGTYLFSFVNGRYDMSKSEKEQTELVFIGEGVGRVQKKIISGLESCEM